MRRGQIGDQDETLGVLATSLKGKEKKGSLLNIHVDGIPMKKNDRGRGGVVEEEERSELINRRKGSRKKKESGKNRLKTPASVLRERWETAPVRLYPVMYDCTVGVREGEERGAAKLKLASCYE